MKKNASNNNIKSEERTDSGGLGISKPKSGWVDRARKTINDIEHFGKSDIFNTMNKELLQQVRVGAGSAVTHGDRTEL